MIALGSVAQDKITGFKGTVVARTDYMTGCSRYCIQPKTDKEGKIPDDGWFDENFLKVTSKGISSEVIPISERDLGGPQRHVPPRR